MEQTATLRIQTDESGNKFIAGVAIGDMTISKSYIKLDDSDEQRRIAALETQVNQLSVQISSLQSAITVSADHVDKLNAILDSISSSTQFEALAEKPHQQ
ncbi:hypothetical protein [Pectobacterium brasiliense]|uniref:hypothetical protein n=1 Tax=Pectobacterium brasiliense TaxID=180957 RepID=UPI00196970F0|nr:hypothetical protein [Pectobacterium brasiliense]MBN3145374.1 hypothetical protein [Pectobacterium brasiliense]